MLPRRYLYGIFLCLLLAGCKITGLSEQDLPGDYVTHFPDATEMLVLSKDGSYTQVIYISAAKDVVVHEGLWHYRADSITLENPILPYSANPQDKRDLKTPHNGLWSLSPHKLLGRVYLDFDPDQGFEFRKL